MQFLLFLEWLEKKGEGKKREAKYSWKSSFGLFTSNGILLKGSQQTERVGLLDQPASWAGSPPHFQEQVFFIFVLHFFIFVQQVGCGNWLQFRQVHPQVEKRVLARCKSHCIKSAKVFASNAFKLNLIPNRSRMAVITLIIRKTSCNLIMIIVGWGGTLAFASVYSIY